MIEVEVYYVDGNGYSRCWDAQCVEDRTINYTVANGMPGHHHQTKEENLAEVKASLVARYNEVMSTSLSLGDFNFTEVPAPFRSAEEETDGVDVVDFKDTE